LQTAITGGTQVTNNLKKFALHRAQRPSQCNILSQYCTISKQGQNYSDISINFKTNHLQFYPEAFPNREVTLPGPEVVIKFPLADI
jgi:hypothetical protein